jgi:hypothetical protein
MDFLSGKTIRWSFDDGPMAGTTIDHSFHDDGSVTWSIVDGPHKGASVREKSYGAVKVNEKTWALSYLSASRHTLTVILSLEDGKVYAFGSNDASWTQMRGRFSVMH